MCICVYYMLRVLHHNGYMIPACNDHKCLFRVFCEFVYRCASLVEVKQRIVACMHPFPSVVNLSLFNTHKLRSYEAT